MPYKRNVPLFMLPEDMKNLIPVMADVEPKFEPTKVICAEPILLVLATPVANKVFCKVVLDGFGMYITKLAPPCVSPDASRKLFATRWEVVLPFAAPA